MVTNNIFKSPANFDAATEQIPERFRLNIQVHRIFSRFHRLMADLKRGTVSVDITV